MHMLELFMLNLNVQGREGRGGSALKLKIIWHCLITLIVFDITYLHQVCPVSLIKHFAILNKRRLASHNNPNYLVKKPFWCEIEIIGSKWKNGITYIWMSYTLIFQNLAMSSFLPDVLQFCLCGTSKCHMTL